jgi:hypothetical protein
VTNQPGPDLEMDRVNLTLPNDGDYVALARFAAGIVAARAGFDLEEVQDLQLAVDEMYVSSGVPQSGGGAEIEISRSDSQVSMVLTYSIPSPMDASERSNHGATELSQQLLTALVDEHGLSTDDHGTPRIWIRKAHVS